MKTFKSFIAIVLVLFLGLSQSSCVYRTTRVVSTTNNGKHKGWYKNSHNPHHPNTTNPGNGNGNGKSKGKKGK